MPQHDSDRRLAGRQAGGPGSGTASGTASGTGSGAASGAAATTRRGFLGMAGAGALGALAGVGLPGRAVAAPVSGPARLTVPRTLAWTGSGRLVRPDFPVEYVAVRWPATRAATGAGTGTAAGRIRFADASGRFGAWQELRPGCGGGRDDATTTASHSALVPAGAATAYELDAPAGTRTAAYNTTAGPQRTVTLGARDRTTSVAGCRYLSRARWGADESWRLDASGVEVWPPEYFPVQTITVHHTAGINDNPDPAASVRAIYFDQAVTQGWGDIGYHFLIDEAGQVYEGRYSGDDGIPGFDANGQMVNAAHVAGFNAGNVGIAVMGNFMERTPTAAARRTLTALLAMIAGTHGIDPLSTVDYVNPISGATWTGAAIPGHRNWAATLCPGDLLAADLPDIRQDVAGLLGR